MDRLDSEAVAFHERVAAGYRQMVLEEPDRWHEVDATAGPDEVAAAIFSQVARSLQAAGIGPVERRSA
jgi:dTMP kinase